MAMATSTPRARAQTAGEGDGCRWRCWTNHWVGAIITSTAGVRVHTPTVLRCTTAPIVATSNSLPNSPHLQLNLNKGTDVDLSDDKDLEVEENEGFDYKATHRHRKLSKSLWYLHIGSKWQPGEERKARLRSPNDFLCSVAALVTISTQTWHSLFPCNMSSRMKPILRLWKKEIICSHRSLQCYPSPIGSHRAHMSWAPPAT